MAACGLNRVCIKGVSLLLWVLTLPLLVCNRWYNSKVTPRTGLPKCKIKALLFGLAVVLAPYMYFQLTFPVRYIFKHSNTSSACVIPHPDPFDPSILKFVWHPDPLVCDSSELPVIYIDDHGLIQFNKSALNQHSLEYSSISCTYSILKRHIDDDHVILSNPVVFIPPIHVNADFLKIICKQKNNVIVVNRLFTNIRKTVNRTGPEVKEESSDQLSVILFGIDSVSRSQAIRKLPKTFKYLTEDLQSYDFKGYMKVGENTLPNIVPLLTGRRVWTTELPIKNYSAEPYDAFPLVWKNFSAEGYATFYSEDAVTFSTFNYLTRGFVDPPTDHYMRPFMLRLDEEKMPGGDQIKMFLENRHIKVDKGSVFCHGNQPFHVVQINYLKQFIHRYAKKRKFALSFMNELSHEYPNFLEYADETILEFLKWMKSEGHLDNSAFILFSDHGARIDKIRNTFVGRIEDRMPVFELVLPAHVRTRFPRLHDNLMINTNRLSTHFDVHQTMVDILFQRFNTPTKSFIDGKLRSISLFRELPSNRTCADAWIPENYCACYTMNTIDVNKDPVIPLLTSHFLAKLNKKFKSFTQCSPLVLHKVQDAHEVVHGLRHAETENTGISLLQFFRPERQAHKRYFVAIETHPGLGIFEGTLTYSAGSVVEMQEEPVRVNKYGNQSSCVNEKVLKPFCYCKQ